MLHSSNLIVLHRFIGTRPRASGIPPDRQHAWTSRDGFVFPEGKAAAPGLPGADGGKAMKPGASLRGQLGNSIGYAKERTPVGKE